MHVPATLLRADAADPSDAGAHFALQVIKVEPPEGDSMRYVQRQPQAPDGSFQQNGEVIDHGFTLDNRGKQSIAVNLTTPEGQEIVRDLAKKADVFLTNLLPVRLARYGLDYATIDETNPQIVYCSISGWGLVWTDTTHPAAVCAQH